MVNCIICATHLNSSMPHIGGQLWNMLGSRIDKHTTHDKNAKKNKELMCFTQSEWLANLQMN